MKSVDEHKLDGTYRPHRHADRAEIITETLEELPIPDDLEPELHAKFIEVCRHLGNLGILAKQDADSITAYCQALHLRQLAWNELQSGIASGGEINPAFRAYLATDQILRPLRSKMGLEPRSRQSLKTKKAVKKAIDPMETILGKNK